MQRIKPLVDMEDDSCSRPVRWQTRSFTAKLERVDEPTEANATTSSLAAVAEPEMRCAHARIRPGEYRSAGLRSLQRVPAACW